MSDASGKGPENLLRGGGEVGGSGAVAKKAGEALKGIFEGVENVPPPLVLEVPVGAVQGEIVSGKKRKVGKKKGVEGKVVDVEAEVMDLNLGSEVSGGAEVPPPPEEDDDD